MFCSGIITRQSNTVTAHSNKAQGWNQLAISWVRVKLGGTPRVGVVLAHQYGAAFELDAVHHLRRQVHGLAGAVVEPPQPVLDAVHLRRPATAGDVMQPLDPKSSREVGPCTSEAEHNPAFLGSRSAGLQ